MISLLPVAGLPEVRPGDDLAALIAAVARLEDRDVVVVAQKVVSKAEGRLVRLADVVASPRAIELAAGEVDPREIEVILAETERVVRLRAPFIVSETRHGLICGSAGVDHSNSGEDDMLVLLPEDPDASARKLRDAVREQTGADVAVIVADSFGRPFRMGTTDVAIGVAGLAPIRDLRGTHDRDGRVLRSTLIAVADELAAAADLARRKESGVPVVIVRGFPIEGDGSAQELVMPRERSLFD
ncbi:unannotated protein [freshwater metagenome]|uniref:Unannotated protein n=1 Tax=freshwater metagenome TaxID=449393 RepID=A0A6J6QFA1_9ZZZZ